MRHHYVAANRIHTNIWAALIWTPGTGFNVAERPVCFKFLHFFDSHEEIPSGQQQHVVNGSTRFCPSRPQHVSMWQYYILSQLPQILQSPPNVTEFGIFVFLRSINVCFKQFLILQHNMY